MNRTFFKIEDRTESVGLGCWQFGRQKCIYGIVQKEKVKH